MSKRPERQRYFSLYFDQLDDELFIEAPPEHVKAWIYLARFCFDRRTGGVIEGAESKGDAFWWHHGFSPDLIRSESPLWRFDGGDLKLTFYDHRGEEILLAKSRGGGKRRPKQKDSSEDSSEDSAHREEKRRVEKITTSTTPAKAGGTEATEAIWSRTPRLGRTRSSRKKLDDAWKRVPASKRPTEPELTRALDAWCRSEDWTKDGGQYVPGIHRWVTERKWEDLPEPATNGSCL